MTTNSTDYNNVVGRAGVSNLIPTEYAKEIIQTAVEGSFTLPQMTRLNDMPTKVRQLPVMSLYPTAYFVSGEPGTDVGASYADGLKKTTKQNWTYSTITAEELAVVVPIPAAVIDDAAGGGYDIWGETAPRLAEAIAKTIDAAIIHGTNKPTSWPNGIVTDATSKSQVVDKSDSVGSGKTFADLYDAILGEGGLFSFVEADGYDVNGVVAALSQKAALRGIRGSDGQLIFQNDMTSPSKMSLAGIPISFPRNGALDPSAALMIVGDWKKAVYCWRQDITYKIFDQGVITDDSGTVIFNLLQQDMLAMRVTCRLGWQLPNPENQIQTTDASRYPFALLKP
ncbi:phage major capsid protein [Candidatus Pacearchaeota archaeon]|jgi:HK97 family phage major capsid protein|nr:phage major capsid protein [Candidatus Pacearchaeota archaeon]